MSEESALTDLLKQIQACKEKGCNLRFLCDTCQDKLALLFNLAGAYNEQSSNNGSSATTGGNVVGEGHCADEVDSSISPIKSDEEVRGEAL